MQALTLYRSTIGKKAIMAITGLIWIGYVILHMYGNLKAFQGRVYFNEYAEGLREIGAPVFGHLHLLTLARIILVASIALHIWAAYSLLYLARQARPTSYAARKVVQANYASLTMRLGGTVIFLFVLYHLMHFTWGVPGVHNDFIRGDPYHNLVTGLQFAPAALVYILATIVLGFHLYHGAWSMFQTLGFNNQNYDRPIRVLGWILAIGIPIGFAAVPIGVLLGIIAE